VMSFLVMPTKIFGCSWLLLRRIGIGPETTRIGCELSNVLLGKSFVAVTRLRHRAFLLVSAQADFREKF